jgi:hypothetical protein
MRRQVALARGRAIRYVLRHMESSSFRIWAADGRRRAPHQLPEPRIVGVHLADDGPQRFAAHPPGVAAEEGPELAPELRPDAEAAGGPGYRQVFDDTGVDVAEVGAGRQPEDRVPAFGDHQVPPAVGPGPGRSITE